MNLLSLIAPRTMILPKAPCAAPQTMSRGQRTIIEKIDRLSSVPLAPIQKSEVRSQKSESEQTPVSVGTYLRKEGPLAPKPAAPEPLVNQSIFTIDEEPEAPAISDLPSPISHFSRETLAYYETMHAAGGQPHAAPIAAAISAFYATGDPTHLVRATALIEHLLSLTTAG